MDCIVQVSQFLHSLKIHSFFFFFLLLLLQKVNWKNLSRKALTGNASARPGCPSCRARPQNGGNPHAPQQKAQHATGRDPPKCGEKSRDLGNNAQEGTGRAMRDRPEGRGPSPSSWDAGPACPYVLGPHEAQLQTHSPKHFVGQTPRTCWRNTQEASNY